MKKMQQIENEIEKEKIKHIIYSEIRDRQLHQRSGQEKIKELKKRKERISNEMEKEKIKKQIVKNVGLGKREALERKNVFEREDKILNTIEYVKKW